MTKNAKADEQALLAHYIINRLEDRTSGRDQSEVARNYPHDVFFVGNLRPEDDQANALAGGRPHLPELLTKLAPVKSKNCWIIWYGAHGLSASF